MDNLLRDDVEERPARLQRMMEEEPRNRQRLLVEYGITLWERTDAALRRRPGSSQVLPPLTID